MPVVILDRNSSLHFSKFMDMLKSESEIPIKNIKKAVAHSSYYAIVIKKLYSMNELLREIDPKLYLAEPSFSMTQSKKVFSALKRCEFLDIEARKDFFILRFKE